MSLNVDKFLEHLVGSEKTQIAYAQTLRQFESFLNGELPTEESAIEFLADKTKNGCKGSTVMRYGFALRKYFRWKKVVVTIDLPKRKKQLLKWLTPEELEALVEASAEQPLAQALIMLLYDSGMRIGEALGLVIGDIDEDGLILIRETKTGEERKVPLSDRTLEVIKDYLSKRGVTSKKTQVFNINYQPGTSLVAEYYTQQKQLRLYLSPLL